VADPREKAPSGIVFLVGRPPLDRAAALHRRRLVRQFPLPGQPSSSHDPDPFRPFRSLVAQIDLETKLSPSIARNGPHRRSPVAQRHHRRCLIILSLPTLSSDRSRSGPGRLPSHDAPVSTMASLDPRSSLSESQCSILDDVFLNGPGSAMSVSLASRGRRWQIRPTCSCHFTA